MGTNFAKSKLAKDFANSRQSDAGNKLTILVPGGKRQHVRHQRVGARGTGEKPHPGLAIHPPRICSY